jgi:hypothetical protein
MLDSYKIIDPSLELELNKTGTFDFIIYPNNPNFGKLRKMKSIITVYQNDYLIFRGRILNDEQGFYNEKHVSCEGELAFFVDSIQRPYSFKGSPSDLFAQLINNHNAQVTDDKKFLVGNVTVEDKNDYISRSDNIYSNTLDSLMNKLVNPLGGYLIVRHESDGNYLDWLKDFDTVADQTIEFGKNLIDLNRIIKGENVATAIIPLGAKLNETGEERLTIAEVNNGLDYVFDEEAVEMYGWIFRTETWDDVTVASNLLRKAKDFLSSAKNLVGSIEISAIDVPAIGESPFRLGTYVFTYSKPHGLNTKFLVSKLKIKLLSPQSNKLTLGTTYETFTDQSVSTVKTQVETIETVSTNVEHKVLSEVEKNYYLKSETEQLIFETLYPVGAVYISTNSKNPALLFGGTWEQIKDVFLLSAGVKYSAGSVGGEAEHKLTVEEMPSHIHNLTVYGEGTNGTGLVETLSGETLHSLQTTQTGGAQAHNNMPPYLTVYMWKRTK